MQCLLRTMARYGYSSTRSRRYAISSSRLSAHTSLMYFKSLACIDERVCVCAERAVVQCNESYSKRETLVVGNRHGSSMLSVPDKAPYLVARATFSKAHALGSQNRKKDKNQEIRGYIEKSKEREERYRSSIYLAGGLFDNITGTLGEYKCFAFKIYIVVVVVISYV